MLSVLTFNIPLNLVKHPIGNSNDNIYLNPERRNFHCHSLINQSLNSLLFDLNITNRRIQQRQLIKEQPMHSVSSIMSALAIIPGDGLGESVLNTPIGARSQNSSTSISEVLCVSTSEHAKRIPLEEWYAANVKISKLYQQYCSRWILIDTYF